MHGEGEKHVLALGLAVAAAIYAGFALAGAGPDWLAVEALGVAAFSVFAWMGVRRSTLWLAAGWALHAVWDAGLHLAGAGAAFAPAWYALLCISFDLLVAGYVWQRSRVAPARPRTA